MKRALATVLTRYDSDTGEPLGEPYFVSGLVGPSTDGSEWDVELVDVVFAGKHIGVGALSEERQERAKDLLADMAQRAEQGLLYGG